MTIDPVVLAIVSFGLVFSGVVKGATGIGYASCALPILASVLEVRDAIPLVLVPALATNASIALGTGHLFELVRIYRVLYLAMLPGIVIGALALNVVDARLAAIALGLMIIAYSVFSLWRMQLSLSTRMQRVLQSPTGLSTGFVAGLTGSQVLPLIPFFMASNLDNDRFAQAVNIGVLVLSVSTLASMLLIGSTSLPHVGIAFATIPLALVGLSIGTRIRGLISTATFRIWLYCVLAMSGIGLVVRYAIN